MSVPTTNTNYVRNDINCDPLVTQPASTTIDVFNSTEGWTAFQYKDFNGDYVARNYDNTVRTPGTFQARNYDNTVRTPADYQRYDETNTAVLA
jgi:hypothetical protein